MLLPEKYKENFGISNKSPFCQEDIVVAKADSEICSMPISTGY
jgi:hypothetical protein